MQANDMGDVVDLMDVKNAAEIYINIYSTLLKCLQLLCNECNMIMPPFMLTNERYYSAGGWYDTTNGMICVDIKSDDYIQTLLHEFGHLAGYDEEGAEEFADRNHDRFISILNSSTNA